MQSQYAVAGNPSSRIRALCERVYLTVQGSQIYDSLVLWSIRPRQIERADPERTGDGAHEHRAIARKPGQPARVERLLRARLVAFVQFLGIIYLTPSIGS